MIDLSKLDPESKYQIADNTFSITPKDNPKDLIQKEIGDAKTPSDFLPQQKVMRWDNECNVSVRLVHDELNPTVETVSGTTAVGRMKKGVMSVDVPATPDKIVWKGEKVEAHFYDIESEEHPEGASEFEVVLLEKPETNVVQFTLVDKDVEYFYQPALTEKEIEQGASRPENVVGSYAIYATETKHNYVGGKEYKCGKVGHIYRPRIEDANGDWIWGDLNIDKGILSVTIPQDFLDKAVYPVRHAAGLTFGYTTKGASNVNRNANYFSGNSYTSPASISTISSFTFSGAIYNPGTPTKSLLVLVSNLNIVTNGVGAAVSVTGTTWYTSSFSTPPTVSNSTDYILAYICGDGNGTFACDSTGGSEYYGSNNYTTPTSPVSASTGTRHISIYATYTAGVGSAPTVTTQAVSSISDTTATGNGNVTADGGASVTERGVCWATTSGTESTAGSHANNGTGTGAYTVSMPGLSANTLYYVKAYAINSVGTSYGSEVSFTTNASGGASGRAIRNLLGVGL